MFYRSHLVLQICWRSFFIQLSLSCLWHDWYCLFIYQWYLTKFSLSHFETFRYVPEVKIYVLCLGDFFPLFFQLYELVLSATFQISIIYWTDKLFWISDFVLVLTVGKIFMSSQNFGRSSVKYVGPLPLVAFL